MGDGVKLTDHALVRYLERVKGFDLDAFRKEILTPDTIEIIKSGKECKTIKRKGFELKIEKRVIKTVITTHMRTKGDKHAKKKRSRIRNRNAGQ